MGILRMRGPLLEDLWTGANRVLIFILCSARLAFVDANGGAILPSLNKNGKGLSGDTNWETLLIILGVGAAIIAAAGLGMWLHKRWKKKKEEEDQVHRTGSKLPSKVLDDTGGLAFVVDRSPPPSYRTVVEAGGS